MTKKKTEPNNVLKLIAEAKARKAAKPQKPSADAQYYTAVSLWARIRNRKPGSGGR